MAYEFYMLSLAYIIACIAFLCGCIGLAILAYRMIYARD